MITTILVFAWLALIVTIVCMLAKKVLSKKTVYPFKDIRRSDIPYITIDIQGTPLNMIVDTGCGVSIISIDALQSLQYTDSPRQISLQALTSDSLNSKVVTVEFNVGNKKVSEDFMVYNNPDIANFQSLGITIHGILGTEFFENVGCNIDFVKHALILP